MEENKTPDMTPEDQVPEQPETEEKAEGTVEEAPQEKPEKKSLGREILEWVVTIVAAVAIALVIRTFIFEPVRVDGQSMDDTLADGEIMIVSKLGYSSFDFIGGRVSAFGNPKRFDVVICRYPGRSASSGFPETPSAFRTVISISMTRSMTNLTSMMTIVPVI